VLTTSITLPHATDASSFPGSGQTNQHPRFCVTLIEEMVTKRFFILLLIDTASLFPSSNTNPELLAWESIGIVVVVVSVA